MIIKNAKSKNHIRSNHTVRSICIALLTVLIFSASSVYAASEVIIVSGNGSGVSQFADYNSNTTVANSYIVVDSNVPFSNAFNALSRNIAKLTSTAASSNLYINTTNSYIATLYTYLSNNLPGQWQTLTDIKTATTNTAASSQAALTLMGDQVNIDWVNMTISSINAATSTQNAFDGTYINSAQLVGNDIYIRLDLGSNPNYNSILKFVLPIIPYNSTSEFILQDVYIMNSVNSGWAYIASPNTKLTGNTSNNATTVYYDGFIRSYAGANISNKILLHIHSNQSIYYLYNNRSQSSVSYITTDKVDYHTVYDTYLLEQINNKKFNATVDFDDTDIIDAIKDLSLQDNDVQLNLTINNNTGSDGTTIIERLQQFLNTGVSVGDFFDNVDAAESGWFSQSNSDVINTLSRGYTDFYE